MATIVVIAAFSCNGTLPSALADAKNLARAWLERRKCVPVILVESERDRKRIRDAVTDTRVDIRITHHTSFPSDLLHVIQSETTKCTRGLVVTCYLFISSHGFVSSANQDEPSGRNQQLGIASGHVDDDRFPVELWCPLSCWLQSTADSVQLDVVATVDTCHSGTLLDLPYSTILDRRRGSPPPLISSARAPEQYASQLTIVSVSACTDQQSSQDDIGLSYGWGGGLVGCFLDFALVGETATAETWIPKAQDRLALLGQQVTLGASTREKLVALAAAVAMPCPAPAVSLLKLSVSAPPPPPVPGCDCFKCFRPTASCRRRRNWILHL